METSGVIGSATVGAGRYAPSPSGDLHLGNLRTAMLAWLFARSTNRRFLIRVEDIDRDRDAGTMDAQLSDLAALGLDWDGEPILQTELGLGHEAAIEQLREAGLVYECTCTRREILEAPRAPHGAPGAYPGTCRDRSEQERAEARRRIAPRSPALRLNVAAGFGSSASESVLEVAFEDLMLGRVGGPVDDFVLRRGDGTVAYNLAVVVDDAAMGIDQVVRGDDLALSTPRQIALQRLLGLPSPPEMQYVHVPLVLGPGGVRLAKRDGAVTVRELADQQVSAGEVRDRLAQSLGLAAPGEQVTMSRLLERFDPAQLPRKPWRWNSER